MRGEKKPTGKKTRNIFNDPTKSEVCNKTQIQSRNINPEDGWIRVSQMKVYIVNFYHIFHEYGAELLQASKTNLIPNQRMVQSGVLGNANNINPWTRDLAKDSGDRKNLRSSGGYFADKCLFVCVYEGWVGVGVSVHTCTSS